VYVLIAYYINLPNRQTTEHEWLSDYEHDWLTDYEKFTEVCAYMYGYTATVLYVTLLPSLGQIKEIFRSKIKPYTAPTYRIV